MEVVVRVAAVLALVEPGLAGATVSRHFKGDIFTQPGVKHI